MKNILLGCMMLTSLSLFAQSIEVIGGANVNSFFDYETKPGHFNSDYKPGNGYTFRVAIDEVRISNFNFRFTLSYDKYGGELDVYNGGLGSGSGTIASIEKSVISLGIFPVNFTIFDNLAFNLGVEMGGLINESFSGTRSVWIMGPSSNQDLNDIFDNYSSDRYFGLRGRIAYAFNVTDKIAITPQYSYYLGLLNEFVAFPTETRSMRHNFSLGVQMKIR